MAQEISTPHDIVKASNAISTGLKVLGDTLYTSGLVNSIKQIENPQLLQAFTEIYKRQGNFPDGQITKSGIRGLLSPVIVAGCGSTGTAASWGLTQSWAMPLILLDPGTLEFSNHPRQSRDISNIGKHKAESLAMSLHTNLPNVPYFYTNLGVEHPTFLSLLKSLTTYREQMDPILDVIGIEPLVPLVIDAVDVTTLEGWKAKYLLHDNCFELHYPVISALDVGERSLINYWDYSTRAKVRAPLKGLVTEKDMQRNDISHFILNTKVMPKVLGIPMVDEDYAQLYLDRAKKILNSKPESDVPGMPQERRTSALFESSISKIFEHILLGKNVHEMITLHTLGKQYTFHTWISVASLFISNYGILNKSSRQETTRTDV